MRAVVRSGATGKGKGGDRDDELVHVHHHHHRLSCAQEKEREKTGGARGKVQERAKAEKGRDSAQSMIVYVVR